METGALADRIWNAVESSTAISPVSDDVPDLTIDAAYEIQDQIVARHQARDGAVSAAKLGLTSRAKQQQMNVSEPLYGWMTSRMRVDESVSTESYIQPRAEPEVAFVFDKTLQGPDVTTAEVLAATASVAPALDILDSRFAGYRFTLADVVADNSSAGGYVLGEMCELPADLRLTGCVFEKNDELVATAAGAAVMDHPASAVAWFIRKLSERDRSLLAGTTVLAGAWTEATPVEAGDVISATFDHLGTVEVKAV